MPQPCLPPSIEPFQRLQVNDGLLLTAQLWRQAHDYHRQRQNTHYQSLNQPGIVWGLGVCVIAPPMDVAEKYRDRRWLEIQPGLAIDAFGNPIVVPQPIAFRFASPLPLEGILTAYVTVRYVDPDHLQGQGDRRFVQETFRIDETIVTPPVGDIELCRIRLQAGQEAQLSRSGDVLSPGVNQLDLRHRQQAQASPLTTVRVAQLASQAKSGMLQHSATAANLAYLLQSLDVLYPAMQGSALEPVSLQPHSSITTDLPATDLPATDLPATDRFASDLLHLSYEQLLHLTEPEKDTLQQYLATGAIVLVEASAQEAHIKELSQVQQQLQTTIAALLSNSAVTETRRDLEAELAAVTADITQQVTAIATPVSQLAQRLGIEPAAIELLARNHPLRTQPFLFAQLPIVEGCPLHLFHWGGLVLAIGTLSSAWGIDETLSLSRETIRTAQEMGINLLHFAWKRRQLTQLQEKA